MPAIMGYMKDIFYSKFDNDYNPDGVFVFEQYGKRTSLFFQLFTHPQETYLKVWEEDELIEIIPFPSNVQFEKIYKKIDLTDEKYYQLQKPRYYLD